MSRRKLLSSTLIAGTALSSSGAKSSAAAGRVSTKDRGWPKLLAHWKFDGDTRDAVGDRHGTGRAMAFVEGHDGRKGGAAEFNGVDSMIEVADHDDLHFGTREFSIATWVKLEEDLVSVIGDVFSKFDPMRRQGVNLSINGSSGGYSGVSDAKNVQFGIDNGVNGSWTDCGRPWKTNPLIGSLTVYKGDLYTGISDASRPEDACHVFRYAGGTDWVDCGRLGNDLKTPSVYSMIVHKSKLYGGTGMYDWERARAKVGGFNHVYVYEGGKQWRDCGQFSDGYRPTSLASYKGALYAGDDYARCFRYDGKDKWTSCGQLGSDWNFEKMFNSTTVWRGELYAASLPRIYRYAGGTKWDIIGDQPFGTTQVHKLAIYDSHLWAGTWPFGKVLRYEGGKEWSDRGQLGIPTDTYKINEVNDLWVYNGKMYAGVIPKAEVYRYEGGTEWTMLRRLVVNPKYTPKSKEYTTWARVPSMALFQGRLYCGTSTCIGRYPDDIPPEAGRVYAMEAGKNVSYDDDLGSGWKHLVVVKERGRLKLYINGELKATSSPFDNDDYELSTNKPLLIGLGAQNNFFGALDDFRIYGGALTLGQVKDLQARH